MPSSPIISVDLRTDHMVAVRARMSEDSASCVLRADKIYSQIPREQRDRLIEQALKSRNGAQRIYWLRREADSVVDAASPISACRSGCAHCCNIGVYISEPEAKVIGREIGRLPASPSAIESFVDVDMADSEVLQDRITEFRNRVADDTFGVPCTFLGDDDKCTIYRFRPIACRHLVNLDVDDLLCRLVPDESISVPYLDRASEQIAYVLAMGVQARIADIRVWFPKP